MPTIGEVISALVTLDVGFGIQHTIDAAASSKAAIRLREQLGIPFKPRNFDEAYKAALIDYGISKPQELLALFEDDDVCEAFQVWFDEGGRAEVTNRVEAVLSGSRGDGIRRKELTQQVKQQIGSFGQIFENYVQLMKNPQDKMQDREIRRVNQSIHTLIIEIETKTDKEVEIIKQSLKSINKRIVSIPESPEPVIYLDTVYRDRRQSELAIFLHSHKVQWDYHRHPSQEYPTIVLPGARFEIRSLLGIEQKNIRAMTIPLNTSGMSIFTGSDFREQINKLSQAQSILVVLSVTSERFITDDTNIELHGLEAEDIMPRRAKNETGIDIWYVEQGEWKAYSWYICPDCDLLSAVPCISAYDIHEGYYAPPETCPDCMELNYPLCARCGDEYVYAPGETYCEYCQYQWDKM